MSYQEYKKKKTLTNAYEEASKLQESFALSTVSTYGAPQLKPYEGYVCVLDILNKIDAMNRMFETTLQANSGQDSLGKIVEIINNLYDLAQSKLSEAKKQSSDYMNKAAGIQNTPIDIPTAPTDNLEPMDSAKASTPPSAMNGKPTLPKLNLGPKPPVSGDENGEETPPVPSQNGPNNAM